MLSIADYIHQAKVSSDFLKVHLFVANYKGKFFFSNEGGAQAPEPPLGYTSGRKMIQDSSS